MTAEAASGHEGLRSCLEAGTANTDRSVLPISSGGGGRAGRREREREQKELEKGRRAETNSKPQRDFCLSS